VAEPGTYAVIVNPAAAGGRALRHLAPAVRRLRARGAGVTVGCGTDAEDARRVAADLVATRPDALVALGGDGMAHIAVQAVAGTGVPLGLVPVGTGNDLARALGVPRGDPVAAADVIAAGRTRLIDAARAGGEHYTTVLTGGFASRVAERMFQGSGGGGSVAYVAAMVAELRTFRPVPFTLELDGEPWRTDAMLVAVGNTAMFGGGMRICPDADPADGLLDVCVVGPVSRPEFLRVFPRVYRGTHTGHPAVEVRRAATVTLAAPGDVGYADGERMSAFPLTVRCEPGAVRVVVP
jgi:diacylglycerol kinase (ATP)